MTSGSSSTDGYGEREFEYRTEVLSLEQVLDGKTLGARLTAASAEGWHLVDIVDAGDRRVLVLRKLKKSERVARSVLASDSLGRLRVIGSINQARAAGTSRVSEIASHSR